MGKVCLRVSSLGKLQGQVKTTFSLRLIVLLNMKGNIFLFVGEKGSSQIGAQGSSAVKACPQGVNTAKNTGYAVLYCAYLWTIASDLWISIHRSANSE